MTKRQPTVFILLAAGLAAGYLLIKRSKLTPSVGNVLSRCEDAAEALDRRLGWLSGLSASEKTAAR